MLIGSSHDPNTANPMPVHNRGVFLNNRTYFTVENLIFNSNFAMNAWIKSHDSGYATLFSTNTECLYSDDNIINFSWRVSNGKEAQNGKKGDKKRLSMLELKDWTNDSSSFMMKVHDPGYKPLRWANTGFTVKWDWEDAISTVTFYGFDCNFYVISQLSTP